MKRLLSAIAILCILAVILCMTGCGESKKPETTTPATEAAAPETTEAPAEETTEVLVEEIIESPAEETTEGAAEEITEAPAEETTEAAAEAGSLEPSIIIEYGDYDGIVALAQDAMNMRVAEGTVVQISGYYDKFGNDQSIMENGGEGVKKGLVMHIEGDWEAPATGTDIQVIGTMTKGTYVMELHLLPENITILE